MLIHTPVPLSQGELLSVAEFLAHPGRAIVEKVLRGQVALATVRSTQIAIERPLDVLANGPQNSKARELSIEAARLKLFLDVLAKISDPESKYEFAKFDVE
jgi:hypothetical protein